MSDNPAAAFFQPWLDNQKNLLRSMAEQKPSAANLPGIENWAESLAEQGREMSDVMQQSMAAWASFAAQSRNPADGAAFDIGSLKQIIDPAAWSKAGTGWFDRALMRLTDGPA